MDWVLHKLRHTKNPGIVYGPVMIAGIMAAPRRCLFCMRQGIYVQSESNACYIEHIEHHIRDEIDSSGSVRCPHYSCPGIEMGMREFGLHLRHVHGIEM